jgi:hypothetical protein
MRRRLRMRSALLFILGSVCALCAATAWADPVGGPSVAGAAVVGAAGAGSVIVPALDARAALRLEVELARSLDPHAFAGVEAVKGMVLTLDARRRGPFAVASAPLKALGDAALVPMLGALLDLTDPAVALPAGWSERHVMTWAVGLLDAIGHARDPRALPMLAPFMDDLAQPQQVLFAAAQAAGRIGTDEAAALISQRLRVGALTDLTQPDGRRDALIYAAGSCRRALTADALLSLASAWPADADPDATRALIRALHTVANAQAWKTPVISATGEGLRVHAAAEAALGALWRQRTDLTTREELSTALRIIGAPVP